MLLIDAYLRHESALRASVRGEYQVTDIRSMGALELAGLVAWLPAGSALWRSSGGPLALTASEETLRWVEHRLQVLAWLKTENGAKGRNAPKPPERIPFKGDAAQVESHALRQAEARRRRGQTS